MTPLFRCPHLPLAGLLLALIGLLAFGQDAKKQPPTDKIGTFTIPPGWTVELAAGPPLVERPFMACLDDRGRLFVAESAGLNLKAEDLLKQPPNFIRMLEDSDGDGKFDKSTIFADKMTFPMGVLWYQGALYTCSPPSVWKLEDTNDDGVADRRTELVTKFGFTGNAADIHGPFLGPDGRFYWCDGRHGHEIKKADGTLMKGKAARIFRCKPDGSEVEVVCGGGMDNPVEIAFTDEGEAIATVDIYQGRPVRVDALIHCVWGGVFPYHEVWKEFKQTGDLLPTVSPLGWVAPSGLCRYRGPGALNDSLLSAQFNRHRIQRHPLLRAGASFSAVNDDWLVSSDNDFHPTDVLEDADGSVLVIDTGGWFRIGCPTSQIAKPDILGGIYRLRRKDQPRIEDPRGSLLKWDRATAEELVKLLDDPRFAVRDRAVETLATRGGKAINVLREVVTTAISESARRNAVWALTRIETPEAREAVRLALADKSPSIRNAAAHSAGLHRDAGALEALLGRLKADDSLAVIREAATALGRIRDKKAVPALATPFAGHSDRFLEHALIFALIEIGDAAATRKGLDHPVPDVPRQALIALDQMDGGNLTRDEVTPFLESSNPALQRTALGIVVNHPDWAEASLRLLAQWLGEAKPTEDRREALRGVLLTLAKDKGVQDLVARSLATDATPPATRLLLLEVIAQAPLDKLPAGWIAELNRTLDQRDGAVVRQAVQAMQTWRVTDFDKRLLTVARDEARSNDVRLAALAAALPRMETVEPSLFRLLTGGLDASATPLHRLDAARAMSLARLDAEQLTGLADRVSASGALELPLLLTAYERDGSAKVGLALTAALAKSPGLTALASEGLRRSLARYPAEVHKAAEPLLKRLEADTAQQRDRLKELEPLLTNGDVGRGRQVFFGNKAACAACHAVKNEGSRIGPDLTTIGAIRPGRDLLESVVFPSASLARGYESVVVTTRDGKQLTGILVRETAEALWLVQADRSELRFARSNVDGIEPGRLSVMPQGLDGQLSQGDLRDLLAFLQSLR